MSDKQAARLMNSFPNAAGRAGRSMLRVGVVGCGYWGSKHVRVLSTVPEVAEVVAVDISQAELDRVARLHPQVVPARCLADVVDDLHAVVVATPPRTHGRVAAEALAAGCDVLVEKPLATSVAEAENLVRLADRHDRVLMSGHTFEYNPAVWKLRQLVRDGSLGEVYHIYTARLNLGLFHGDVNVVWDLVPHDISILNYVLGSRPSAVSAWAGALGHQPVEDVAYLRLHYSDIGLVAQVHVSWLDPCKVRRVTVVGSRKMAVYDDLADDERIKIFDKGMHHDVEQVGPASGGAAYRRGGIECPHIEMQEPLAIEDRAFVDAVLRRAPAPSDGRTGLVIVRVLEAATRSLALGRLVEVDYGPLVEPQLVEIPSAAVGLNGNGRPDSVEGGWR